MTCTRDANALQSIYKALVQILLIAKLVQSLLKIELYDGDLEIQEDMALTN